jgi:hypothetical protein
MQCVKEVPDQVEDKKTVIKLLEKLKRTRKLQP